MTSRAVGLLLCVLFVGVNGNPFDQYAKTRRGVGEARSYERRSFECRQLGWSCEGFPQCCGSLQCYWENGYNIFKNGVCVECVEKGKKCQSDVNCCEGMQCDKLGFLHVDGHCQPPRESGQICFSNPQCDAGICNKKWYQVQGVCP